MKRIIRLTESDLTRIVRRVIKEQETQSQVDLSKLGLGQYSMDDQDHVYTTSKGNTASFLLTKKPGGQGPMDVAIYLTFPKDVTSAEKTFNILKEFNPKSEMDGMSSLGQGMGATISSKVNSAQFNDVVNKIKRFL
jgi:hypothetical protein